MRVAALSLLALAACGPDLQTACEDYIAAADACFSESIGTGTGTSGLDPATVCAAYDGMKGADADAAADLLSCYADAYNNADCSTTDGYLAASTESAACVTAAAE